MRLSAHRVPVWPIIWLMYQATNRSPCRLHESRWKPESLGLTPPATATSKLVDLTLGHAKSVMDYIGHWIQYRFSRRRVACALHSYLPTQRNYLHRQQQAGSGGRGTAVRRCSHLPDLWFDLPSERHMLRVRILLNERRGMLLNGCYVRRYTVSTEIAKPGISARRAASFSF
jgi:hypothetical protein